MKGERESVSAAASLDMFASCTTYLAEGAASVKGLPSAVSTVTQPGGGAVVDGAANCESLVSSRSATIDNSISSARDIVCAAYGSSIFGGVSAHPAYSNKLDRGSGVSAESTRVAVDRSWLCGAGAG